MSDQPRRIGLLGGTFDPIHIAHLHIATCALHELQLDEVRFVPAGTPPHKGSRSITSVDHRIAMIDLAIGDHPWLHMDPVDVRDEGPSYTSDLLARIRIMHPRDELWFIIGADSLEEFETWHAPDRIIAHARLAVATRPGHDIRTTLQSASLPGLREATDQFHTVPIDLSSTVIRDRLRQGLTVDWLLPASVIAYIDRNQLYRQSS